MLAEIFTRVTGHAARHEPMTARRWGQMTAPLVGPAFEEDATQMMQWAAETPDNTIAFGSQEAGTDESYQRLGVRASTFKEWLPRSGWKGPE